MKLALVAINSEGKRIYRRIKKSLPEVRLITLAPNKHLSDLVPDIFDRNKYEGLIFIMALGIVVRVIAPYIKNKYLDPAVVVIDDCGHFVISALCGHEGGANALSKKIASILNAQAIITTASYIKHRNLIIGIGCRKGAKKEVILKAIKNTLKKNKKSLQNVQCLATISLKAKEPGLKEAARELKTALKIIPYKKVKDFTGDYTRSAFVKEKIGVEGVCEPCALLAARETRLILKKQIIDGVTLSIAQAN